jgi:Domain of unknown function (DUF4249)
MKRPVWALPLVLCFMLTACEKNVHFDLNQNAPRLVVEATIENDQPPHVVLSQSLDYFSTIDPQQLANSFVHGADITVSGGTQTQRLKEYSVSGPGGYALYYYTVDSNQLAAAFNGQLNHAYTLNIKVANETYTANTTIPNITKVIDSVWWKRAPASADTTKVVAMVRVTDPPGFGDYVRYLTKRNREPFYPPLNSAFDDLFIDGTTYEIQVEPGIDRNAKRTDNDHYFNRGDTVTFKLSNIDKATYDFWRTMEYSYASVGNPFSTPVKVLGNISNNALGYFGGYATQYRTLIIPH